LIAFPVLTPSCFCFELFELLFSGSFAGPYSLVRDSLTIAILANISGVNSNPTVPATSFSLSVSESSSESIGHLALDGFAEGLLVLKVVGMPLLLGSPMGFDGFGCIDWGFSTCSGGGEFELVGLALVLGR